MNNSPNELEAYFREIGELGKAISVSDDSEDSMDLSEAISLATNIVLEAKANCRRIIFIGNGGSAGIASHMATDWMKNGGFITMSFNDGALLTCVGNDLGFDRVFSFPLSRHAQKGDVLFAISSSGQSPDILDAVDVANSRGVTVFSLSGFQSNNSLRKKGKLNFYVPNNLYGFVEIAHLAICHSILDIASGWTSAGGIPLCAPTDMV